MRLRLVIVLALIAMLAIACRPVDPKSPGTATATPATTPVPTPSATPSRPTLTPSQTALAAAVQPGRRASLHIEADANAPPGDDCERLFVFAMPASSPNAPGRVVECTFSPSFEAVRYAFTLALDGSLYLDRVELLLRAKATLPQPYRTARCTEIREHLLTADEPVEGAAYVLVCWQVPPLPSGEGGGRNAVWGAVPEDATRIAFPARTYCWQLVPYLGAPRGVRTLPVPCLLD